MNSKFVDHCDQAESIRDTCSRDPAKENSNPQEPNEAVTRESDENYKPVEGQATQTIDILMMIPITHQIHGGPISDQETGAIL